MHENSSMDGESFELLMTFSNLDLNLNSADSTFKVKLNAIILKKDSLSDYIEDDWWKWWSIYKGWCTVGYGQPVIITKSKSSCIIPKGVILW